MFFVLVLLHTTLQDAALVGRDWLGFGTKLRERGEDVPLCSGVPFAASVTLANISLNSILFGRQPCPVQYLALTVVMTHIFMGYPAAWEMRVGVGGWGRWHICCSKGRCRAEEGAMD